RAPPLRRRDEERRTRPGRLPCADPRPLGRRRRARDTRADHPGGFDVAADPRAARLRAGRRGAHAARQVRFVAKPLRAGDRGVAGASDDGVVIDQEAPMKVTLLICTAVALALSASAAACGDGPGFLPGFKSPTGNIKCYYNPHGLTQRGFTPVVRCG